MVPELPLDVLQPILHAGAEGLRDREFREYCLRMALVSPWWTDTAHRLRFAYFDFNSEYDNAQDVVEHVLQNRTFGQYPLLAFSWIDWECDDTQWPHLVLTSLPDFALRSVMTLKLELRLQGVKRPVFDFVVLQHRLPSLRHVSLTGLVLSCPILSRIETLEHDFRTKDRRTILSDASNVRQIVTATCDARFDPSIEGEIFDCLVFLAIRDTDESVTKLAGSNTFPNLKGLYHAPYLWSSSLCAIRKRRAPGLEDLGLPYKDDERGSSILPRWTDVKSWLALPCFANLSRCTLFGEKDDDPNPEFDEFVLECERRKITVIFDPYTPRLHGKFDWPEHFFCT